MAHSMVCIAWYMAWHGVHGMVYMAWCTWHGVHGMVYMAWYTWHGIHGIVYMACHMAWFTWHDIHGMAHGIQRAQAMYACPHQLSLAPLHLAEAAVVESDPSLVCHCLRLYGDLIHCCLYGQSVLRIGLQLARNFR
jgi:hypothetical protein